MSDGCESQENIEKFFQFKYFQIFYVNSFIDGGNNQYFFD